MPRRIPTEDKAYQVVPICCLTVCMGRLISQAAFFHKISKEMKKVERKAGYSWDSVV